MGDGSGRVPPPITGAPPIWERTWRRTLPVASGWGRILDPRYDSRQSPQLKATLPHVHLDCCIWVGMNVGAGLERESKVKGEVRCETGEGFRVWWLCEG